MTRPVALLAQRIRRQGPLGFDQVVEAALYGEGGFFASGGGAGRDGADFITSPEVGGLFGAVLARAFDEWWAELGRPDPFFVIEAGAGAGTLARAVLAASPACLPALRYVLVERSAAHREAQKAHLDLELPAFVLGPSLHDNFDDQDGPSVEPGRGPLVTSLEGLPVGPFTGVILANELLDNLPFALLERRGSRWHEVRVGLTGDDRLAEVLVPASPLLAAEGDRLAPTAPQGARVPVQHQAGEWLRDALGLLEAGRVVIIDYAVTSTSELAERPWGEWVRTYRAHGTAGPPLDRLGDTDITVEVCIDQLARVRRPALDRSQADFLTAHGLDALVAEARAAWQAAAASPD
ncbi:MAG: SAM-dependent methyltransferase, partial [Acidimicrobiales bacterium]